MVSELSKGKVVEIHHFSVEIVLPDGRIRTLMEFPRQEDAESYLQHLIDSKLVERYV